MCGTTCLHVWNHVPACVEPRACHVWNHVPAMGGTTCLFQTPCSITFCFFLDGGAGVFFTVTKSSSHIAQFVKKPTFCSFVNAALSIRRNSNIVALELLNLCNVCTRIGNGLS